MAATSTARASETAASTIRSTGISLAAYERCAFPLNSTGQVAVNNIPRMHKIAPLETRLADALGYLSQAAADINDRLQLRVEADVKAARKKNGSNSQETQNAENLSNAAQEQADKEARNIKLEEMLEQTTDMTDSLEEKLRHMIDAQFRVKTVTTVLKDLNENLSTNQGSLMPTQASLGTSQTGPPAKRQRQNGQRTEDHSGSGGERDSIDDATQETQSQELDGPTAYFRARLAAADETYLTKTMTSRYCSDEAYKNFKNLVHDARHPGENAPPLAHPSTWFPEDGHTNEGDHGSRTENGGNGDDATQIRQTQAPEDEDEDIQVASERISIRCPLTLLVMDDPVKSTKCVHSFEKAAILELINQSSSTISVSIDAESGNPSTARSSTTQRGGRQTLTKQKATKCPCCDELLTASNLAPNPVLLRKITRLRNAARARADEFDEIDGDGHNSHLSPPVGGSRTAAIDSSPAPATIKIKQERVSQIQSRRNNYIEPDENEDEDEFSDDV